MLTPELVLTRRKGGRLQVATLSAKERARALEVAELVLSAAQAAEGGSRGELKAAWAEIGLSGREKKLFDGFCKLVEDAAELDSEAPVDPVELRRAVFTQAAEARAADAFDRERVLAEAARSFGIEAPESVMYADLKSEHRLVRVPQLSPEALLERYQTGSRQAVLLRAVRVVAEVRGAAPEAYRALFSKLKFRRLLHRIEPLADGGYRITIDGPFSLFDNVTKYGLALALVLPVLEECGSLALEAELRWGPRREPIVFEHRHRGPAEPDAAPLPDEVADLQAAFERLGGPWAAERATEILNLPGVGLCVPDLTFVHAESGRRVHLEVLGFWSRDAVWRRVELVEQGLLERVVFAVSSRLRVSEEVLGDAEHAALYVYKGAMSAKALLRRLDALA
ncbi:MAG: DUF790 family protein [Myxococcales bacterium]|nr:DUF790 family protein [Myxococcales bacterium]MCB9577363.1 DUF790 family protein [Polyangiaceae bacterium]